MKRAFPVAALLVGATLWGLSWWPLKYFYRQGIGGIALVLVAYGSVALVLLPWMWHERKRWKKEKGFVLLMLVLGGYANIAFANAMIHGDVVRAMMLFYLAPVWGVLGGRLFLGERLDVQRWLGVLLALAGAFLVLGAWRVLRTPPTSVDFLAISSGFAFALNNVTTRAAQGVPQGTKAAATFLGCALMALLLMETTDQSLPRMSLQTWLWLAVFGLGWLLVATLATQWGVTCMEAGRASVILILELLVATISATLIGGERLSGLEMAGGAMIFIASLLEALRSGDGSAPAGESW